MSPPEIPPGASPPGPLDDVVLRELVRDALRDPTDVAPPDLLLGVQRRLRARSRGKFYGDGWSTARASPRSLYLVTCLFMLGIVVVAFLVLAPGGGARLP